ncbi:hypothetical protein CONLIGDRAFT_676687 [Coniochaeta ligniaria NRRL 30616]|uniref:Uncharacterized protein n=1 Tax=Coniochaeta ligniaria NRRL 30616 TaxID=1408157 RepID=A0A1J7JU18_9PEZI|nr:hypothetical protein CONLIGDRAFT_676687 [Coniochaeta ligniaria NRRL 30616]
MARAINFKEPGLLALAGIMGLSLVGGQVTLGPSTITQAVTLVMGTPASEFTVSVVRTGLVTVDAPGSDSSPTPPSSIPTVFVSASSGGALNQPFSLPTQQAVVTQAPCVSACLQQALIASAAGPCGLSAGTAAIDNACACLSAPLVAVHALTNCASAACTGIAAGPAGSAPDLVAVTSLYNDYCATAVGAEALASAVSSGQAFQATAAAAGSSTTDTMSMEMTMSMETTTPWSGGTSNNMTMMMGNATATDNLTFADGATLTVAPTVLNSGITTGVMSTTSATDAAGSATRSEANLELPRKPGRAVLSLVFALTLPLLIL